jgi:hypothetical protein
MQGNIPFGVLEGLVDGATKIEGFVPASGDLAIGGSLAINDGVVTIPAFKIDQLQLPFGAGGGSEDKIIFGGVLSKFEAKRMNAEGVQVPLGEISSKMPLPPPVVALLSKGSPMLVQSATFEVDLDKNGLKLKRACDIGSDTVTPIDISAPDTLDKAHIQSSSSEGRDFIVDVDESYITALLEGQKKMMQTPGVSRTEAKELATGKLPDKMMRPFSRMPGEMDLKHLLKELTAHIGMKASNDAGVKAADAPTKKELTVDASIETKLVLDNKLWRGILDNQDPDNGYVYQIKTGFYGEVSGGKMTKEDKAVAELHCGTFDIYKITSPTQTMFTGLSVTHDLSSGEGTTIGDWSIVSATSKSTKTPVTCIHVATKVSGALLWSKNVKKYFCTSARTDAEDLLEAVQLQKTRFRDSARKEHWIMKQFGKDATWYTLPVVTDPKTAYPGATNVPQLLEQVMSPTKLWRMNSQKALMKEIQFGAALKSIS